MNIKIIIPILLMSLLLTGCNRFYWKEHQSTECVKEKWIKAAPGEHSSQKYLVGMQSGEVYQITDSLFKWQFRSSDIYNQITEVNCYDVTWFGFRNGYFSIYKTIYSVEESRAE